MVPPLVASQTYLKLRPLIVVLVFIYPSLHLNFEKNLLKWCDVSATLSMMVWSWKPWNGESADPAISWQSWSSSGKKNKRAVVVQLMSACVSTRISCTTTKKWPNWFLFPLLGNHDEIVVIIGRDLRGIWQFLRRRKRERVRDREQQNACTNHSRLRRVVVEQVGYFDTC